MSIERAELDSATATIDDLVRRVSAAGEARLAEGDDGVATDLFDVERMLRAASRRLGAVVRRL
jgi:hypothetical protein